MDAYKKVIWVITIVVILLIIPLVIYFFIIKQSPAPQGLKRVPADSLQGPGPGVSPVDAQGEKVMKEKEEEPPQLFSGDIELNTSDEPVRELVKDCSTHPEFAQWLKNENILRRSAAVVDNISNGVSPAPHLRFLLPPDNFKVIKKNGKIILDPTGYIRYQPITMVLVSIDSEKLVRVYRQLLPVLENAYQELGYPGKEFHETLEHAVDVLLKTPIPEGDILLEEKVTTYTFADPRLEALSDSQKHLLRMGPQNVRKIKAKLREIKEALKQE
ncbi:MAG: DUF3014 domain-containing protein [Candidatus Aminicenantes bacterium]|nr:MAG: DUF3014 domain-containing protein [Candidatus Aminicenantes bacterium]